MVKCGLCDGDHYSFQCDGNKLNRCPECNHTMPAHTAKAHNGKGGCAYCKCRIVA